MSKHRLIFLDETGCHPKIGPRRGWTPIGKPFHGPEQAYSLGQRVTVMGAMTREGMLSYKIIEGGMTRHDFCTFMRRQLIPKLRKGDILCLDNVNTHKNADIRRAVEDVGATMCFIPPYSPDFNPIEAAWSKIKHLVRKRFPQNVAQLKSTLRSAIRKISARNSRGYFKYCGYQ